MYRKIVILFVLIGLLAALVPAASAAGNCARWHTVQRGDNLFRISLRYDTSVAQLQQLNQLPNVNHIYVGQQLCISTVNSGTPYVIRFGDTLSKIARSYGVNMHVLAQVNNIIDPNRIFAGHTIRIPDFTIQQVN